MVFDDGLQDAKVQWLVVVNGDVAESDHRLHLFAYSGRDHAVFFKKGERIAAMLRQSEFLLGHDMHGQIDAGLARPLQIQNDRILFCVIL